jgi:membrane associated rhomboid family serine protease
VTILRLQREAERINEWALVLSSESIPYEITESDGFWAIRVEDAERERAEMLLQAYDSENAALEAVDPFGGMERYEAAAEAGSDTTAGTIAAAGTTPALAAGQKGNTGGAVTAEPAGYTGRPGISAGIDLQRYSALAVSALLLLFFAFGRMTGLQDRLLEIGAASAGRILRGELWRVVTSLTLHANLIHVLSNAFSCWVFCTPVLGLYGVGIGWVLVLLSGAGGNLLTALVYRTAHTAVGASTALFGAVGMLGGWRCAYGRRYRIQGRKSWIYIAGTLTLVAVMGTGENADVLAHLFGAVLGVVFGFAAARRMSQPEGRISRGLQGKIAAGAAVFLLLCWFCALYLA